MSAVELARTDVGHVTTVRDALAELLRVASVRDALKDYEDSVRSWLRSEYDRLEADTGTAPNFAAKGLGRAYLTDPTLRPRVTDQAKVDERAAQEGVGTVLPRVDSAALQHDVDKGLCDDGLLSLLRDCGYVRDERVLPESWLDDLAASCVVVDGRLVDADGVVVEGVEMVAASRPTLVFRADSAARRQMVARLTASLPQIGGAS